MMIMWSSCNYQKIVIYWLSNFHLISIQRTSENYVIFIRRVSAFCLSYHHVSVPDDHLMIILTTLEKHMRRVWLPLEDYLQFFIFWSSHDHLVIIWWHDHDHDHVSAPDDHLMIIFKTSKNDLIIIRRLSAVDYHMIIYSYLL